MLPGEAAASSLTAIHGFASTLGRRANAAISSNIGRHFHVPGADAMQADSR
jgi:hypothetical protein